jgi:hypothetical protein
MGIGITLNLKSKRIRTKGGGNFPDVPIKKAAPDDTQLPSLG